MLGHTSVGCASEMSTLYYLFTLCAKQIPLAQCPKIAAFIYLGSLCFLDKPRRWRKSRSAGDTPTSPVSRC
jgi:hypothetical protein